MFCQFNPAHQMPLRIQPLLRAVSTAGDMVQWQCAGSVYMKSQVHVLMLHMPLQSSVLASLSLKKLQIHGFKCCQKSQWSIFFAQIHHGVPNIQGDIYAPCLPTETDELETVVVCARYHKQFLFHQVISKMFYILSHISYFEEL